MRYLSGFRGEDATLVVGREAALIVTDSRYFEQVHEEVARLRARRGARAPDLLADTAAAAARAPRRRLHASATRPAPSPTPPIASLRRAHDGRLRDVRQRVSRLRMVKEPAEVEAHPPPPRRSSTSPSPSSSARASSAAPRRDVAWRLLEEFRDRGAEGESFPAIVAAGDHGAQGHAIPGERRIKAGELVVIDTGARVDGYCSDITRTFAAGRVTKAHRRLYDVVLEAQLAGLAAVRPGAHGRDDVDAAARAVIAAAGYGEHFGHGTGHGVGLEVHEAPCARPHAPATGSTPGMVCTVEPGIYLEGDAGVRIEDTVARHRRRLRAPDAVPEGAAGRRLTRPGRDGRRRAPLGAVRYHVRSRAQARPAEGPERPMADVVTTNQFKSGMAIEIDGEPYTIVESQHVKPGKGGAFVRTKVRSIKTGNVLDKTFRAGEKFTRMDTRSRNLQYLYSTETEVVLMDTESYEQLSVSPGHGRRGHEVGRREHGRPGLLPRRRADRRRGADDRRAHDHPHRARPARRHRPGRHQACHARDRRQHPGPAVHRAGRAHQGRHAHRRVPQPRLSGAAGAVQETP